ncbi:hypothetical protein NDU88_010753, partial [Pleurodeles waltl]
MIKSFSDPVKQGLCQRKTHDRKQKFGLGKRSNQQVTKASNKEINVCFMDGRDSNRCYEHPDYIVPCEEQRNHAIGSKPR